MINYFKNNISKIDNKDKFFFIILSFFPLSLILGNAIINLFIFCSFISFLMNFKEDKLYFKNKIILLLFFFLVSLLVNIFFSQYPSNSYQRVIKIIFIIFFIIEALRIFDKYHYNQIKDIFFIWFILLSIIIVDCFIELIFGFNITGNKSYMDGRIASFFGKELVVGAFVHGFALYGLSFLISENKKNYILFLSILIILTISFLIGERSNFIKLFFCISLFSLIVIRVNYFYKISILLSIVGIILIFWNFSENYKNRYLYLFNALFEKNGIEKFYKNSQYGAHKDTALKIFKEYPIFGVGIKNFRYESGKQKYFNKEYTVSDRRQATHPHQIHLEFLSETGLFGYISFLIFILSSVIISTKNYLKNKNIFQLSGIIFIFSTLIPLLPSGSFLSTFNSSIFWINFAIMVAFYKDLKLNHN